MRRFAISAVRTGTWMQRQQRAVHGLAARCAPTWNHEDVAVANFKTRERLEVESAVDRTMRKPYAVPSAGSMVLFDPLLNKGTAFPYSERDRLQLRGLLPSTYAPAEVQIERILYSYRKLKTNLEKYNLLSALQDRNEVLFYRILSENITEMAPIIYTPTVGEVCQKYGLIYRRPRGMYFSVNDRYEMNAMVYNWPHKHVDVICVTDGSRILGLGDLGVHGMGIPVGKLSLYVAGGGIHPARVLPCVIDAGTDNEDMLADPLYLGIRQRRLRGEEYHSLVDEFMRAVTFRFPNALVQFEDFNNENARDILDRWRWKSLCFNDDIQGTGAVALSGVLTALRKLGQKPHDLPRQRIVVLGAGSAGLGVVSSLINGMVQTGVSEEEARQCFWLVDKDGLLGQDRGTALQENQRPLARHDMADGLSLQEVIDTVQPTVLLGLSGVGGAFEEPHVRSMAANCRHPIIFPMSNPSSNTECTPEQALTWTDGRAVVATGSPFDITHVNGKNYFTSQANNMFIFPGVGLAGVVASAKHVTDAMFYASAVALSETVTEADLEYGKVYPDTDELREVSLHVAASVVRTALEEGMVQCPILEKHVEGVSDRRLLTTLKDFIRPHMWDPRYLMLVEDAARQKHRS